MRALGVVVVLLAFAAPARSDEIYRWTDEAGQVHYANGAGATRVPDGPPVGRKRAEAANEADASAPVDDGTFSAGVSLRRNALERDLRATEKRLHELDARIATLVRARKQNGAPGVVGTNLDLRSEEEKTLATEREQVAQHAAEVRSDGVRLREEVTARSGGSTPAWWIDVR